MHILLFIYMHTLQRQIIQSTLYVIVTLSLTHGGGEEKRGKLPGQMDENSRESRDSDALESVSTKRLSFTRITHIIRCIYLFE